MATTGGLAAPAPLHDGVGDRPQYGFSVLFYPTLWSVVVGIDKRPLNLCLTDRLSKFDPETGCRTTTGTLASAALAGRHSPRRSSTSVCLVRSLFLLGVHVYFLNMVLVLGSFSQGTGRTVRTPAPTWPHFGRGPAAAHARRARHRRSFENGCRVGSLFPVHHVDQIKPR